MDLNRFFDMVLRIFVRRGVNWGINRGADYMARRGKSPDKMSPADHSQARAARDIAKRARKAARITRRMGR